MVAMNEKMILAYQKMEDEQVKEKERIACANCGCCSRFKRVGMRNAWFRCDHPDEKYISNYFREHKLIKMPRFLGYGKDKVPIKTSPRWCPLRRKEAQ